MSTKQDEFIEIYSYFTKIHPGKIREYLKLNSIETLIEHPQSIHSSQNQLDNINKLNELTNIYDRLAHYKKYQFNNPSEMVKFFSTQYENKFAKESFLVAFLDDENKLLGVDKIFEGTLSSSVVHPRDIMKKAIQYKSSKVVLSHNHPSGDDITPSEEDVVVTGRLFGAGIILGVEVLDHIIVGRRDQYYSFAESGRLFPENIIRETSSTTHNKIYSKDLEKAVELLSKFLKIPKMRLKETFKEVDINEFNSRPEKYIDSPDQLEKMNMLKSLSSIYHNSSIYQSQARENLSSPQSVSEYIGEKYKSKINIDIVLYLNSKNEVISGEILTDNHFGEKETQRIISKAILYDSASILISSKDKKHQPNERAREMKKLSEKCKVIGIPLLDNLNITGGQFKSYRQMDILEEKKDYVSGKDLEEESEMEP